MSLISRCSGGIFVGTVAMLLVCNEAIGQTQKIAPQKPALDSAEQFAAALWEKFSVVCQISGGSSTTFVAFPVDRSPSLITELVEFRGAWRKVVPLTLTEADRLNGVQSRAMALIGGAAIRTSRHWVNGINWSDWRDITKKSIPATLKDLNFGDIYAPIVLVIEKHDNRWFCTHRPWSKEMFELSSLDPVPLSCATLIHEHPGPAH